MNQDEPAPPDPARRPLRVLDLMALVAAVAMTLISPSVMKAIIPTDSHNNWDRRQYVAHLVALVMIWWSAALSSLVQPPAPGNLVNSINTVTGSVGSFVPGRHPLGLLQQESTKLPTGRVPNH
jgi:hypothetical protein